MADRSLKKHEKRALHHKNSSAAVCLPLADLLSPAKGVLREWTLLGVIALAAVLFRWGTASWNYSGYQTPPMFGDFEAQRHWLEITIHLPISRWYFYDLEWWGLDYPPLTAYHSWFLGQIGSRINSRWFALDVSRGLEESGLKIFMRASVLLSEYLTYVPALWIYVRSVSRHERMGSWTASVVFAAILMQPSMILIDHGHFQYNTVMLGFTLGSVAALRAGRRQWACILFVAALSFKQMALYYAPVMFSFHLGSCLVPRISISRLLFISLATVLSFCALFLPLVIGSIWTIYIDANNQEAWYTLVFTQLRQCGFRVFPFARGLFEDKVANIWCALHTFHKLNRYPQNLLQRLSLLATIFSILPPSIIVGLRPNVRVLPLAMTACAWGFFLFSFQVHEKSVLLPLMPMTLLLTGECGMHIEYRSWICWANLLGCWTMFPLLKRDQLAIPYLILTALWAWLMGVPRIIKVSLLSSLDSAVPRKQRIGFAIHTIFYAAMITWHLAEAIISPPRGKPDLWVVANVLIGAAGFTLCYFWSMLELFKEFSHAERSKDGNIDHQVKVKPQ